MYDTDFCDGYFRVSVSVDNSDQLTQVTLILNNKTMKEIMIRRMWKDFEPYAIQNNRIEVDGVKCIVSIQNNQVFLLSNNPVLNGDFLYKTRGSRMKCVYMLVDSISSFMENQQYVCNFPFVLQNDGEISIKGKRVSMENRFLSISFSDMLGGIYKNPIAKQLLKDNIKIYKKGKIRNITIRTDNLLSYTPSNVETEMHGHKWGRKGRSEIKPAKLVRKIYGDMFEDKDYEEFANHIKAYNTQGHFKVVEGRDIAYWYDEDNYNDGCGTLDDSCMRDSSCNSYFDIYTANRDVCSMLILVKDGKINGRALLWKTDDGTKLMDRIYGRDSTVRLFKNWADENGYLYKHKQSYNSNMLWGDSGDRKAFVISLDTQHDEYPFMDTFYYVGDGHISNSSTEGYSFQARDTDGRGGENTGRCCSCSCDIDIENESFYDVRGDILCSECGCYSEYDNEDMYRNDAVWSDYYNSYLHRDNARYSEYSSDYYPDDMVTYIESIEDYLHQDDDDIICLSSGENEIIENASACEDCGEWFRNDEVIVSDHDDCVRCISCNEEHEESIKEDEEETN